MSAKSLRDLQKESIFRLLSLVTPEDGGGSPTSPSFSPNISDSSSNIKLNLSSLGGTQDKSRSFIPLHGPPVWKILILDGHTQAIVSPLIKVNELREHDVTLFLQIENRRLPVPKVPAVYFIEPTSKNIQLIAKDMESRLYGRYYFHFVSYVSRELLEELALQAVRSSSAAFISKVTDQYADFISIESNLFTFSHALPPSSFYFLNHPATDETQLKEYLLKTATSLMSTLVTLDTIPIIRYEKNTAAEGLAKILSAKLRDQINIFSPKPQQSSASDLCIILERSVDLATPFRHQWSYGALIYDCFQVHLNRISLPEYLLEDVVADTKDNINAAVSKPTHSKMKVFDLDLKDKFWKENQYLPFPTAVEAADKELQSYRSEMDKMSSNLKIENENILMNGNTAAGGGGGDDQGKGDRRPTNVLQSALVVMPGLTERKRWIDVHLNVAQALLETIKQRSLDIFYSFESNGLTKGIKKSFLEIIKSPQGSSEDKLRLFLYFFLSPAAATLSGGASGSGSGQGSTSPSNPESIQWFLNKSELADIEKYLTEECSVSPSLLNYVKQFRSWLIHARWASQVASASTASPSSPSFPASYSAGSSPTLSSNFPSATTVNASSSSTVTSPTSATASILSYGSKFLSSNLRSGAEIMSTVVFDNIVTGMKSLFSSTSEIPLLDTLEKMITFNEKKDKLAAGAPSTSSGTIGEEIISPFVGTNPTSKLESQPRTSEKNRKIIIFMLGGITFDEMQQIQAFVSASKTTSSSTSPYDSNEHGSQAGSTQVIVGSTEIINSKGLIQQIEKLADGSNK